MEDHWRRGLLLRISEGVGSKAPLSLFDLAWEAKEGEGLLLWG